MRTYLTPQTSQLRPFWLGTARGAVVGLLIGVFCMLSQAQSGRRLPKTATPAPTPEEKTESLTSEKKDEEKEKARLKVILGIDGRDLSYGVPGYFYEAVLYACADRLREAPSIKLDVLTREINRGEAVKLAKSQKEAFVAFLELRANDWGRMSGDSYEEISINYTVFAPQTAKNVTSGRTYQRAVRKGGVVVGPRTGGRTSPIFTEQMLKQAARDAAERILAALHLEIPGRSIPPVATEQKVPPPHKAG